MTPYVFFRLAQEMHREGKGLYLRKTIPEKEDGIRYLKKLYGASITQHDIDYGKRLIQVLAVAEQSAEEIVCLADPLCYVSHLSAMQRWGLTNRSSKALLCSRPARKIATPRLSQMMAKHPYGDLPDRFRLYYIKHPETVRGRPVRVFESKVEGASIAVRDSPVRLATIGQTFLDMLQQPRLCGGMSHVLDIYDEHATTWLDEIVTSVDSARTNLVKIRAGYILEEQLRLHHDKINGWKGLVQRGGGCKLDPSKAYSPVFSENWMISLNA
ncbi:MAG: hypothetical protein OXG56_02235 [Gammaproteobacteria bacterium]|nr:hypothetical protein [Gammaproteobacteria bacterium]